VPVPADQLREFSSEPIPNHLKRWWFCIGGTPLYLFIIQLMTGVLLAIYYKPSTASAYESVNYITNEVTLGWFIRSVHKWAGTLMVAAIVLHQLRVFFTGAYRKPRELNWIIGMLLLMCVLFSGFTGYSLVFEQLSYWAATVGGNITASVPAVGSFLGPLMLGGEGYNEHTLSRFFVLHGAVLPGAVIFLLILHVALIRLHGVTELRFGDEKADAPKTFKFFPDHFLTELIIGLVLMILLCFLATTYPAITGPKANPLVTPDVIKPEWFFYVTFRWLKFFPIVPAVLSMGLIILVIFLWPFIDAVIRRRNKDSELSVWIGILGVLTIIVLTVWEGIVAH